MCPPRIRRRRFFFPGRILSPCLPLFNRPVSDVFLPVKSDSALTMSYDDGVGTDHRLIDIMRALGLKGTFNINAGCFAPEGTVYPAGTVHRRMSESGCLAVSYIVTAAWRSPCTDTGTHGSPNCQRKSTGCRLLSRAYPPTLSAESGNGGHFLIPLHKRISA